MNIKFYDKDYKFKVRVSAAFIYNNKLFVDKYGKDKYCLPGGTVNLGESSIDAVKRELKEEIGYDFEIDKLMGVIENFYTNFKNVKTHCIEFYYKVNIKNQSDIDNIDLDRVENDHGFILNHHYKWIDIDKIGEYSIVPKKINEILKNNVENFHYIIDEKDR